MNGELTVDSPLGGGTTVRATLPVPRLHADPADETPAPLRPPMKACA
jgi:hypothetical protein